MSRFTSLSAISIASVILLTACGGGGIALDSKAPTVVTPPVVTPPELTPEVPSDACVNESYAIVSASDDGEFDATYEPSLVIDGNTTPASRWSSLGANKALTLDLGSTKSLGSLKVKWFDGADRQSNFAVETSTDNSSWEKVLTEGISSGKHSGFEQVDLTKSNARYIKIVGLGNTENDWNSIVEVEAHSCEGADGQIVAEFPNELGIELIDWYLSVPTDEDNNGRSDSISEKKLAAGYTNSEFFYASADGGIVMRSPSYGFKTSTNTSYVRVELREMLRRGNTAHNTQGVNKNNWVFGSASASAQADAGGTDGELNVTLAVNNVTTTGENYQIGRLVIGQIHANDDEPIRLYYRKLPNNDKGSIYFAHESRAQNVDEAYVEMIGTRSNSASNPADGIALDEKFSYRINVTANLLTVTIIREGKGDVVAEYDMTGSLFDEDGQYQYFKVGVYHLNNSSDEDEYAQATFYEIRNSHLGYAKSE
ncbi:polysaccharide lyase family 7 protein [Paraglaciecola aquimarina]|uniref:Polysaccharide lyase family 7 protein n=1 Tax=Paraglaciecola algarum TaxID=3050085 RepID=A0ABS9D9B8_9ALTE|nr:polysaccharide lyase family 7 protein [Paraglaciecola sp. G1-23]MCF2949550.1 polysaccharide lyase family 7 protein [Paraglaciecola sp. G1-23]